LRGALVVSNEAISLRAAAATSTHAIERLLVRRVHARGGNGSRGVR
jgi:hypothetical protein